ncbi:hypothetical protein [Pleurocapsa sp. PCC 7319]|uniref:hypothetical protein n=1 Tax=Pleurocapsa sp. PCC 7319 TaxID=118161 RepID=UPI0004757D1E|nr:hypothetical protein [Pleurocapsa sp. PCC 7319]
MECHQTDIEKPTKDLTIALKSEVLGEAFFRSAYYSMLLLNRRHKAKMLWHLEAQTKTRILEYFEINSIEIPKLRWAVARGSVLGVFCLVAPWYVVLKVILKETEYYQEVFRRLEEQAIKQDKELFGYIVAHEAAIRRFVSIELVGGNNSLDPIEALLNN